MCPAALEVSQAINEPDISACLLWAQEEGIGSCPEPTLIPSNLHRSSTTRSFYETTVTRRSPIWMLKSDEAIPLVGAPASNTKTLREDCHFYTSYSFMAGSPRFTDSVTLLIHPHVQNVTTLLLQCGLL